MIRHSLETILVTAWAIGIAHVISGVCIIIAPEALMVSSLAGLNWITTIYSSASVIGGVLIIIFGGMAVAAGTHSFPIATDWRVRMIAPQVFLLVFALASIITAIAKGHFPDGYVPKGGSVFILADQSIVAVVAIFHVLSVLTMPLNRIQVQT